jgi:raffinose/stachyose/melibiose transport system substrate-binding protein
VYKTREKRRINMKKKVSIIVSIVLVMTLLFTACGGGGADSGGGSGERETLIFWSIGLKLIDETGELSPEELAANRFIRKFEEEHNVTVEVIDQPVDAIHDLFRAANLAETGPDVIGLWSGSATNEHNEFLLPLDDFLTADEKDMYTGLTLCRVDFEEDGALIALPYNLTTYNIFYNKELFAQAGVTDDDIPETWDEFIALNEKIQEAGIQPMLVGDSGGESTTWIMSEFLVDLLGPEYVTKLGSDALPFTSPQFTQVVTLWSEFFSLGFTNNDVVTLGAWDSIPRFVGGEAAMNINGSWAIGEMYPIMGDNLGTFRIPAITADAPFANYIVSQPGANVSVTSYASNPELAVEFIKFMTSPEFMAESHGDTGDLPANNRTDSAVIENHISRESYSWLQENTAGVGFDSIVSLNIATEIYRLGSSLFTNRITPEEFIDVLEELR